MIQQKQQNDVAPVRFATAKEPWGSSHVIRVSLILVIAAAASWVTTFAVGIPALYSARGSSPQATPPPEVTLKADPSCTGCRIALTHELTIGAESGDGLLGYAFSIVRSPSGFYALSHVTPELIYEFDAEGAYVRTVGRTGDGPGEFQSLLNLSWRGDTLMALDQRHRRWSVLSTDLTFVRAFNGAYTTLNPPIWVPDGLRIVNSNVRSVEQFGYAFHVVNEAGDILASFGGSDGPIIPPNQGLQLDRPFTVLGGKVYGGYRYRYVVDEFDAEGEHQQRLVRSAAWFRPATEIRMASPGHPPLSQIQWILPGPTSTQVTVIMRRSGDRWEDNLKRDSGPDGDFWGSKDPLQTWDTQIEVLDVERGVVVASSRFDGRVIGVIDDNHIYMYRELPETGGWLYDVMHVHVTRF